MPAFHLPVQSSSSPIVSLWSFRQLSRRPYLLPHLNPSPLFHHLVLRIPGCARFYVVIYSVCSWLGATCSRCKRRFHVFDSYETPPQNGRTCTMYVSNFRKMAPASKHLNDSFPRRRGIASAPGTSSHFRCHYPYQKRALGAKRLSFDCQDPWSFQNDQRVPMRHAEITWYL